MRENLKLISRRLYYAVTSLLKDHSREKPHNVYYNMFEIET